MTKTAVAWLYDELVSSTEIFTDLSSDDHMLILLTFVKAIDKQKEQIVTAYTAGINAVYENPLAEFKTGEEYFDQMFDDS